MVPTLGGVSGGIHIAAAGSAPQLARQAARLVYFKPNLEGKAL